jgi:predicted RND superfamily exporter protein
MNIDKLLTKKYASLLIVPVVIISILFIFTLPATKLDYSFNDFFPKNDSELNEYKKFVETFESDNDYLLIGLKNKAGIFDKHFLTKVDSLSNWLGTHEDVIKVISPTSTKFTISSPMGITAVPYLHPSDQSRYSRDSLRVFETGDLVGSLFSENGKSLCLYVKHPTNLNPQNNALFVSSIEEKIESLQFDEFHLAGKVKGQFDFISQMKIELVVFVLLSILVIAILLYFTFRMKWAVLLPMIVVGLSVIWTVGLMNVFGLKITLISTVLPTILFVVGISNAVHFLERFILEWNKKSDKIGALSRTIKEVGVANFLTCLTTAIGFASLYTSPIVPIKEFGIIAACGVMLTFVLSLGLMPAAIIFSNNIHSRSEERKEARFYSSVLYPYVKRNRISIITLGFALLVLGILISINIKTDNKFIDDWTVNKKGEENFLFFEKEFNGFRPFDVHVKVKDTALSLLDYTTIIELEKIDSIIKAVYKSKVVLSPLSYVKGVNRTFEGGYESAFKIPESEKDWKMKKHKMKRFHVSSLQQYLSKDEKQGRFSSRIEDFGGLRMQSINKQFYKAIEQSVNTELLEVKITGMPYLIDKNNQNLSKEVLKSLLLAFLIVGLLMGFIFKSFNMAILTILPNILPLVLTSAVMTLFGIDLKIATSVIFTIGFGIAVDDTIHFLTKFRLDLRAGKSKESALRNTFGTTGKAIIYTSIILCCGFAVLLFAGISSNFYIGLLITLTLLFAVLSNIFFLPALLSIRKGKEF